MRLSILSAFIIGSLILTACFSPTVQDSGSPASRLSAQENSDSMNFELIVAAFQANKPRVQELIVQGADVRARLGKYDPSRTQGIRANLYSYAGSEHWTPLLALSHNERATNHVSIAQLLLDAGADINAKDEKGTTPLYRAIDSSKSRKQLEALAVYLMERGARVNTRTGTYIDGPSNITPLHRAIGNPRLVQLLIEKGADLNAPDSRGMTPLHYASAARDRKCIQILIQAGADIHIQDSKGDTPLRQIENDEEIEASRDRVKSMPGK